MIRWSWEPPLKCPTRARGLWEGPILLDCWRGEHLGLSGTLVYVLQPDISISLQLCTKQGLCIVRTSAAVAPMVRFVKTGEYKHSFA